VVELDRDVATVVRIVREEHAARAALPHLVDDDVLADALRHVARAAFFGGRWGFGLRHRELDGWQQYSDRCDTRRRVEGSYQVVKHNSEAAVETVIHIADRPGFEDVEKSKENKH